MMEQKNTPPSLRLLVLITNPKLAQKADKMFQREDLPVHYRLHAEGTASSEIMNTLGLGSSDKSILICTILKDIADSTLKKLKKECKIGTVNSGIAFTMPLNGISNFVLRMLCPNGMNETNARKDDEPMSEINHTLIAVIVERGFSAEVMEAARSVGAGGGTVLNSRRVGNDGLASVWGANVQDEKEIVLIISGKDNKLEIMNAISSKCGVQSEAKGVILSLPVDAVVGLPDAE